MLTPADEVKRALLNPIDEPSRVIKEAVHRYGEGFSAIMPFGGLTLPATQTIAKLHTFFLR